MPATLAEAHDLLLRQQEQLAQKTVQIEQLEQQVETLQKQFVELTVNLGSSSSNSSNAPSFDSAERPKRKGSGRSQGAQPGHSRHERALYPPEQVTHTNPKCGVHVVSETEELSDTLVIRAGTLDDAELIKLENVIWTSSAPTWAYLDPSLPQFEHQPPAPSPTSFRPHTSARHFYPPQAVVS